MKGIELPYAFIRYVSPVVYIQFKMDCEIGMLEIRELIGHAEQLCGNTPYYVLSDVRPGINLTPLGKKLVADTSESPLHKGTAVVANQDLMKVAANIFSEFSRPPFPYKVFTREDQALKWLLDLANFHEERKAHGRRRA